MRADVAQRSSPEHCVGHGMEQHIGVGMTVKALFKRNSDAAQNERAATNETVRVVALTHTNFRNRHRASLPFKQTFCEPLVSRLRHFDVRRAAGNHFNRLPRAFHCTRFVRDAVESGIQRPDKLSRSEELRRGGSPETGARNRFDDAPTGVGTLHRIGHRHGKNAACSRTVGRHLINQMTHFTRSNTGARRIMNQHPAFGRQAGCAQSAQNGIGALCAARTKNLHAVTPFCE